MKQESRDKMLLLARMVATRVGDRYGEVAVETLDPELLDVLEVVERMDSRGVLRPLAEKMVRNVILERYAELYDSSDSLTRLGLITPLSSETHEAAEVFRALRPGVMIAITGHPGTGKSYAAMVLAGYAIQKGWVVLSNIPLKEEVEGYVLVRSSEQLLENVVEFWERKKMLVLDEAGLFATTSVGHTSSRNVFYALNIAKISRKMRMAMVWIDQQSEGSIPPYLRSLALEGAGILEMKKPGRGVWSTPGGVKDIFIPPEALHYDTYSISSFDFNVRFERLLERLTGLDHEGVRRYLKRYLHLYVRGE